MAPPWANHHRRWPAKHTAILVALAVVRGKGPPCDMARRYRPRACDRGRDDLGHLPGNVVEGGDPPLAELGRIRGARSHAIRGFAAIFDDFGCLPWFSLPRRRAIAPRGFQSH